MKTAELKTKLEKEGGWLEIETSDDRLVEVFGGRWCFCLTVDGITIKNTKTLAPIAKKLTEIV
jgi:hypothetical protein